MSCPFPLGWLKIEGLKLALFCNRFHNDRWYTSHRPLCSLAANDATRHCDAPKFYNMHFEFSQWHIMTQKTSTYYKLQWYMKALVFWIQVETMSFRGIQWNARGCNGHVLPEAGGICASTTCTGVLIHWKRDSVKIHWYINNQKYRDVGRHIDTNADTNTNIDLDADWFYHIMLV